MMKTDKTEDVRGVAGMRARLNRLMEIKSISMRRLSERAGLGESAVKQIISGESKNPRVDTIAALAQVLGVTTSFLLDGTTEAGGGAQSPGPGGTIRIYVVGAVEAGTWREAFEWDIDDQYTVTVAPDRRYPNMDHFALEVRGPSMDKLYPTGTTLICVRYADIGRNPLSGENVICQRTNREGLIEATVKKLIIDEDGRPWLWPQSTHPNHQQPIALPNPRADLTEQAQGFRVADYAQASTPEISDTEGFEILARVVASYRPE